MIGHVERLGSEIVIVQPRGGNVARWVREPRFVGNIVASDFESDSSVEELDISHRVLAVLQGLCFVANIDECRDGMDISR